MYWRIIVTCLLLGLCGLHSVQGVKKTHALEDSAKTSDFLFDDEDLALADQASGSGPVSAPDLDDVSEGDDVIDEEDLSVVDSQPAEVSSTTTSTPPTPAATPQQPVTPKVSAVASKPEPQPPASRFDDIDIGSGSGDGDTGDNYDDEDDDVDDKSITGEEDADEDDADDTEEITPRKPNPVDTRVVQQGSTPAPAPPSVEPPREENQIPVVTGPPSSSGPALPPTDNNETGNGGAHVIGHKPDDRPVSFFSQPGILAAVVGGAVVGLLCAILLVMFIVYRMRKKDEGSYALDEPKRSPNSYAYNKNSREFFA